MELTKEQIIDLKPHKLAARFPMADDQEFILLKESIKEHGVQIPIVLYGGEILDGRNRHKALKELYDEGVDNISVNFEEYNGTKDNAEQYADSLNLVRRHLTSGQKAIFAIKYFKKDYDDIKKDAKNRKDGKEKDLTQKKEQGKRNETSAEQLAKLVGTNKNYITQAEKIETFENKFNESETKKKPINLMKYVLDGHLKLDDVVKLTRFKLKKSEEVERLETIIKEIDEQIEVIKTKAETGEIEDSTKSEANVVLFKNIMELTKPPKKPAPPMYPQDAENIGIYFSFNVPQATLKKIGAILYKDIFYDLDDMPTYTMAVAKGGASKEIQEAISELISKGTKLDCYDEKGNNEL